MIRKAFLMNVYKDQHDEYEKRHKDIWPEMEKELKKHGALSYSIYLDKESSKLFAYLEIENEEKWDQMAQTEVNSKWWNHMAPLMETNEDNSPVVTDLREVFHLNQS